MLLRRIDYIEFPATDTVFGWKFGSMRRISKPSSAAFILADGKITKPTFEFPGGRRFHFSDPNGNDLQKLGNPTTPLRAQGAPRLGKCFKASDFAGRRSRQRQKPWLPDAACRQAG